MEYTAERSVPGQSAGIAGGDPQRYRWIARLTPGKDVAILAHAAGTDLSTLASAARSLCVVGERADPPSNGRSGVGLRIVASIPGALPLSDRCCDLLIDFRSGMAARTADDFESAVRESRRVLRADGMLVIDMSNRRHGEVTPSSANWPVIAGQLSSAFRYVAFFVCGPDGSVATPHRDIDSASGRADSLPAGICLLVAASDEPLFPGSVQGTALAEAVHGYHIGDGLRNTDGPRQAVDVPRAEPARVRAREAALEKTVQYLADNNANLAAAVQALRDSANRDEAMPLRILSDVARRGFAALLGRSARGFAYSPLHDLTPLSDGVWRTGVDPEFSLTPRRGALRSGWGWLEAEVECDGGAAFAATLFAICDDGHRIPYSIVLGRGRVGRLVALPGGVRCLRFALSAPAGTRFKMKRLSFAPLQRAGLARKAFELLDHADRRRFIDALLRGHPGRAAVHLRGALSVNAGGNAYRDWVALYDTPDARDLEGLRALGRALPSQPLISVLMPVYNPRPAYLRKALDSVCRQTYANWELCIADDASPSGEVRAILSEYAARDRRIKIVFRETNGHICAASNSALERVGGEFVALMDHDDALAPHALYMVAKEINDHPDVDLIYTDEDKVDAADRRHDPHFKSDWNRELFYSQNMVAHLGVYRSDIVRRIGGFRVGFEGSQDYDFVLRFLPHTRPTRIRHIPHVLYHWRIYPGVTSFSTDNPDASLDTARRAMRDYFATVEPDADVVPIGHGWWRVKRPLPDPLPRVSLIVPTRDRLDVLKVAIDGLLNRTDYDNMQLIVVDNDSVEAATLAYFDGLRDDPRVTVLRVPGAFNFSALNNRAAELADGALLGFVNNDIDVIDAGWLREMVAQAVRPNVGAVGARLYYANDTVQHAGVIVGVHGVAAHSHRHLARNSVGYFGRPVLVQNLSAVTAACMLVPRAVFDAVGGYDEAELTVGYNDVDLCLRMRERGYEIVYTPFAELRHLESVSRGENRSAAQIERDASERAAMLARWPAVIAHDPFYNPNLSTGSEDFSLAFPPRVARPWARRGVDA